MNIVQYFNEVFLLEEKGKSLLLLDIDETLVKPKNIFIIKRFPNEEPVKLTPAEYAKEKVTLETKKHYSYEEFRDPDKVARSIKTGIPLITNLKIMDEYIKKGWILGILTARGMEELIFKTMKEWLMYKNNKGNLQDIGDKLVRDLVFAVNDDSKKYEGKTDFEKKAKVIEKLSKEYDRIVFIDDDQANINKVKGLGLQNVHTKLASKEE